LLFWEENDIFKKRVELNSTSKKNYSFMDGPITANNPMGLHHVWGRSLKDLIQRYWAMKGYEQRFQNGFDCQGLWIEVEVEKSLGLNSKQAIEEFGLAEFSNKCKARLDKFSSLLTEESKRLGQWMHWDNSYYTHTDTNISYIWYFLKTCHEKGWIVKGHFPMPWCVRCGTSLSQHEQHDSYKEMKHTAVFAKFPLETEDATKTNEYLLVWTTTPWTLTANTAVAAHPDMIYSKVQQKDEIYYLAKTRLSVLAGDYQLLDELPGKMLTGMKIKSPFGYLTAQAKVKHKVVEWLEVSGEEGTGFVHIAPGCGMEDYELSKVHNLTILSPVDDFGFFSEEYDQFKGLAVAEASKEVVKVLEQKQLLYKAEQHTHRYPTCWRCHEELIFRLVQEWFIDSKEIRPLLKEATKEVEWVPAFYEKRMQDWLNNMGNWCISRKRFWGLPLPFFECKSCGELTVIGSKEELFEQAVDGLDNLKELHRPWIDDVKIRCPKCKKIVQKVTEVGDCWLDAGIVPFSTLKYLEDRDYWNKWFPTEAVCEMREQIRLWFYSQLFMSVTLTGEASYKRVIVHEKVHDKDGKAMHRSWGNAIWFSEAVEKIGADIMRWSFVKQPITQVMNFGYYLEKEVKPFFLTIWNVYSFFSKFANLDGFNPNNHKLKDLSYQPLLDKWLLSSLNELIKEVRKNMDKALFHKAITAIERFVEQLSTWYVRRSRRRFWKSEESDDKISGYLTLHKTLVSVVQLMAPVTPFFSDALYQKLTKNLKGKTPTSVHLCSYPKVKSSQISKIINRKMNAVLEVVKLGRTARKNTNLRLRQPLAELLIWCKDPKQQAVIKEFRDELVSELNVKKLRFVTKPEKFIQFSLKPNYPVLGPKLKEKIQEVKEQLEKLDTKIIMNGYYQKVQQIELTLSTNKKPMKLKYHRDVLLEAQPVGTHAIATSNNFAVAFNTTLTDELVLEGKARDVVRHIQKLRKDNNLQVSDKIKVYYQTNDILTKAIESFREYISTETLAIDLVRVYNLVSKDENIKSTDSELLVEIEKVK